MTVDLSTLKIGDKAKVIYVGADVDMVYVGDIVTVISNDESGYLNYKIELDGDKNSNYEPYWAGIEPRPDLGCSTDAYIQIEKYEEQEKPAQNIEKTMLEMLHKLEEQEKTQTYNPSTAKTDTGKDRLDLLPYAGLASAAKAFEYGMGQYGHNNYQNAKSYRPFLAAAIRHTMKKLDGEDLDKDSGLDHISHSLACLLMAEQIKSQGKPINDPDTMKPYGIRNKPKE